MADNGDIDNRALVGSWYADAFDVGYNALQFKVDCGHDDGSDGEVMKVYLRIIASPFNARELFKLLGAGLLRYADTFGPIGAAGSPPARSEP